MGNFFSANTAALTKNDMKPSFTPCSFSKRSSYFLRRSMTGCMLTSLNVVRIAAVDCDCTRRSATRARSRVIGTRCSGRPARTLSTFTGGGTEGSGGFAAGATGAEGAGGAVGAFATWLRTSALVMRPSRPLPVILVGSTACSSTILRADGIKRASWRAASGVGAPWAAQAPVRRAPRRAPPALAAPAFASVSMVAITSPLSRLSRRRP